MYGPPPVLSPVPPPRGGRVTVGRVVVWVLLGGCLVGGVGMFACLPLTLLAVRGRSRRDAFLAVGALAYTTLVMVMSVLEPDKNHPSVLFSLLSVGMLAQGIATLVHYVRSDRRLVRAGQPPVFGPHPPHLPYPSFPAQGPVADTVPTGWVPPTGPVSPSGPVSPTGPTPVDSVPMPSVPPTPPVAGQPHRLGQVRAELDELSDYLRREQGR